MVITLKSCSLVKPAKPTPNVGTFCISDADQDKPTIHAPVIYFYKPSDPLFSFALASQTLKDSLSQVLVHFYPLAGRLHLVDDDGRVTHECNSAGAMFYEAESDAKIEDFKDFAPTEEVRSLIPFVDASVPLHQQPLVLVQLTRLSCGGISLGTAISHIMADGTAASHFMSEWARITRGESLENPPFLDRSILMLASTNNDDQAHDYSLCKSNRFDPLPLVIGRHNNHDERSKETNVAMLHLSVADIENLKRVANESRDSNIRAYSRYEAVAGHLWRCVCKVRGHSPEQPTKLSVPVNFRKCMSLPKWYFGNAIYATFATSFCGELTTNPLAYAASKIREAIEMVTADNVKYTLYLGTRQPDMNQVRVGDTQGGFRGNPNMEITSWMGIPLDGTDFGWGKEIYMGPGSLNFDGKCFILPGRSEEGSLTLALRLQVSHMDHFTKLFYQGISI